VAGFGAGDASARTLKVRDEGYLRFHSSWGSLLVNEGNLHGVLPGWGRVRFRYDGSPIVTASFTITGNGWSLQGSATCRMSNPSSLAPSFRGHLTLTGGRGRYAHAHGSGELFGVFYRRNYALDAQAVGQLSY
jgi:hypothetical protein